MALPSCRYPKKQLCRCNGLFSGIIDFGTEILLLGESNRTNATYVQHDKALYRFRCFVEMLFEFLYTISLSQGGIILHI